MSNTKPIQNCAVCEKEIHVHHQRFGNHCKFGPGMSHIISDEGYCLERKWFCKKCHNEIMTYSKTKVDYDKFIRNL